MLAKQGNRERRSPRARVVSAVEQWISDGKVRAGDALPSEREMAQELNVARVTIRSALAELENKGVIEEVGSKARRLFRASDHHTSGLLRNTILVLSGWKPEQAEAGESLRGWDMEVQAHAATQLQRQGYNVFHMLVSGKDEREMEAVARQMPAGVMVAHSAGALAASQKLMVECRIRNVPVVCYGDDESLQAYDRVASDHQAGAYELTRWLISQGKRRVQVFWRFPEPHYWVLQREAGYRRAMIEAGLRPLPVLRTEELPFADGPAERADGNIFRQVATLLAGYLAPVMSAPERPDALMVATDHHAYQVNAALRRFGLEPGRDVLTVGYDNNYADCPERQFELAGPAATVDKRHDRVVSSLVELLMDRVRGHLPDSPQRRLMEPQLVIAS